MTRRSKLLFEMQSSLGKEMPTEQRLDVLLEVKEEIRSRKDEISIQIRELISREAELINRKRPDESLEGLRERIKELFLKYIMEPENNPEL